MSPNLTEKASYLETVAAGFLLLQRAEIFFITARISAECSCDLIPKIPCWTLLNVLICPI